MPEAKNIARSRLDCTGQFYTGKYSWTTSRPHFRLFHVVARSHYGFMICNFMNPLKISANSDYKQKILFLEKIWGMLLFQTL